MPPRKSSPSPDNPEAEVTEPVIADTEATIFPQSTESAVFLDDWIKNKRGVHAEALGTFAFFARQNGWLADTPSGWELKFSRWMQRP